MNFKSLVTLLLFSMDISISLHQVYFIVCIIALFFALVSWAQPLVQCIGFLFSDFCIIIALLDCIQLTSPLATLLGKHLLSVRFDFLHCLHGVVSRKYFHISPHNWYKFSSVSHLLLPLTRTVREKKIATAKETPITAWMVKFIICSPKALSAYLGAAEAVNLS
jgi:hypothetical protein